MAGYWNPDNIAEQPEYYVGQPNIMQEQGYIPDTDDMGNVTFQNVYDQRQYVGQGSHRGTFRNPPIRRPLNRIYVPSCIVNQPRRIIVPSMIPPHYVGSTVIQPRPQQRIMQLPHERSCKFPLRPYTVQSQLQESRQYHERFPRPLPAPWPHVRSFKRPWANLFVKSNIPQTIYLNESRQAKWLTPVFQNRFSRQVRDHRPVASNPVHRSSNIYNDGFESDNNSEHNASGREISSSSEDTDSNYSVAPFRNNTNNLPGVKHLSLISLSDITTESDAHPVDTLMKLYFKIYQCYTPTDFFINYEESLISLSKKIWENYLLHQPPINEYTYKLGICKKLQLILNKQRPECQYKLFLTGSTLSGLSLSGGDMDLCVKGENRPGIPDRHNSMFHLESIRHVLESVKEIDNLQIIEAKVPLLRFSVIGNTRITIDMNCNNVVAIANTQLLYAYTKCDWRLQPLNSLIKQWAIYNNINEPWKKTLSSYTIILLIIQFLQCGVWPPVLPCLHDVIGDDIHWEHISDHDQLEILKYWLVENKSTNKSSLGELFIEFFKFYNDLDLTKYVISVRLGKPIRRSAYKKFNPKIQFNETDFIFVEEPFTLSNTAYSVHCPILFECIKKIFEDTRDNLTTSMALEGIFE